MINKHFPYLVFALLVLAPSSRVSGASARDWSDLPNFADLRTEIGWRKDFNELCEDPVLTNQIRAAFESKNFESVIALSDPLLAKCPIDIPTHYYRAFALGHTGRIEEGRVHYFWFEGLIKSILASGDGKTAETAYITISVAEEYYVLSYLGLKIKMQGLDKTMARDRFTVEDERRNQFEVWFNPAAHFARLDEWVKEIIDSKKNQQ
jgi:hypothetical protein